MILFEHQEIATIIAALRFYQENGLGFPGNRSNDIHEIATDGGTVTSLDEEGIDELVDKIQLYNRE
jgi:hypothetical protein